MRLTKQAAAINAALDGINPLNAGKRRDEAIALLRKFFPGMEDFEKQLRKYRREIKTLETDNAALEKRAEAAEKGSFANKMKTAQLQADHDHLRRFVDLLPEEIKQMAQSTKNHSKQEVSL